jgi:hypothetical protein
MRYDTTLRIEKLKMYYSGLKDGIQMYAHWKDGTQYVGTTGKTLRDAIIALNKEEEQRIAELQEELA